MGAEERKNILVVDDENDILEIMGQALRASGYAVAEASRGTDALELVSKKTFDLVITDFEMPEMKGDELVIAIRRLMPGQRLIMASGTWPRFGGTLPKVDFYLDKPFQIRELLEAVRRVLEDAAPTQSEVRPRSD